MDSELLQPLTKTTILLANIWKWHPPDIVQQ
jgi:hypothetical protein